MSSPEIYTDQQIIQEIRNGGKAFQDMAQYLFEAYLGYIPTLKNKLNLSTSELQDAYSDALVRLINQLKNGNFKGESKISSYFYTIFYNASVDVFRKNTSYKNVPTLELQEYDAREKDLIKIIDDKDQVRQLYSHFGKLGNTCQQVLMDWGYYGFKMDEIAVRVGLSNAESARSMKYKCLKKLNQILSIIQD